MVLNTLLAIWMMMIISLGLFVIYCLKRLDIKQFDDGGKNMSFKMENEGVYLEYNEI